MKIFKRVECFNCRKQMGIALESDDESTIVMSDVFINPIKYELLEKVTRLTDRTNGKPREIEIYCENCYNMLKRGTT